MPPVTERNRYQNPTAPSVPLDLEAVHHGDDDRMHGYFLILQDLDSRLPFLNDEHCVTHSGIDGIESENVAADVFPLQVDRLNDQDFVRLEMFVLLSRDNRSDHPAERDAPSVAVRRSSPYRRA